MEANSNGSFTSRVASSQDALIHFVSGTHKGLKAWYYVRVERRKLPLFERALSSGSFDIADYGTVLASGYGSEPPEDVRGRFGDAGE